jgi:hypothetical protein
MRLLVVGALVLLAAPVAAHHTFSAYYIEKDTIEIEGEVIEFQYRNPHAWIHVQGRDLFGREARYAAEWVSTAQLERLDIDKKFAQPRSEREPHPAEADRTAIGWLQVGRWQGDSLRLGSLIYSSRLDQGRLR